MSKSINGVHVFSTGTWNGKTFMEYDLDQMVEAFAEIKEKYSFVPSLKLGHDDEQRLLQNSGMPAAGWVKRLYRIENKLFADFEDMPQTIFQAIKKKMFRKVSIELYYDMEIESDIYPFMIGAIAILGADVPGVMNLDDIMAFQAMPQHKLKFSDEQAKPNFFEINIEGSEMPQDNKKTERELELEKQLADQKAQFDKLEKANKEKFEQDKELAELREYKQNQEAEKTKLLAEKREAEVKAFATELKSEELVTPAMEKLVAPILENKQNFSVGDKEFTKQSALKELLSLAKESFSVNKKESTVKGKETRQETDTVKQVHAKIEEYMQQNKCTYRQAYEACAPSEYLDHMTEIDE